MPEKIKKFISDLTGKWKEIDNQKRNRLIATVLVVLFSLGITIYLATKPKWQEFVSNRPKTEIGLIQTALTELGYKNRINRSGTGIEIESKDIPQAEIDISSKNIPVEGTFSFQNALDVSGIGATEVVKKASLQRFKESELSANMSLFDGVEKATVTLEIPETNKYFIEDTKKPTASVFLITNKKIDEAKGENMAKYLAASVMGLSLEDINITDDKTNVVYSGSDKSNGGAGLEDEIVLKRKNEMENQIRVLLLPMYDDVKISSNLVFNWDKNKVVTRIITPPIADSETGLPLKEISEKQNATSGNGNAEPGIATNNNTAADYNIGTSGSDALEIKNITKDYGYNEEESITENSIGKLVPEDSAMVIVVYNYKSYDQEYMMKSGQIKNNTEWDAFKLDKKNTKLDIDPELIAGASKGTGLSNISIIGYEVPIFADKIVKPVNINELLVMIVLAILILLLAYGLVKTTKPQEIEDVEPELTVENLLVSTQIEEEQDARIEKLKNIEFNKESESKRQIDKFVKEKPEAVAQLLRNWLNDEWE